MRYVFVLAALAVLAGMPQKADAATAYSNAALGLRAGPSMNYPLIGRLGVRENVEVIGCTRNWVWCDVSAGGYRGWVGGHNLITPYRHRNETIVSIGSILGLPIVTYNERDYWGHYYYDRDFYRARYGYHNDADRYGWVRVNGRWQHGNNWHDSDHDGIPNNRDHDDDNDGRPDRWDHHNNNHDRHHYND